jgi:hypothetical protein
MSNPGYPDKRPASPPPVEKVDIYRPGQAPAASRFGVGTSTREGSQQAQDARREQSRELSSRRSTPSSK